MTPTDKIEIKPEEHGLYKAAVTFMVSKRSEEDAWSGIAAFVAAWKGSGDELDAEFNRIEERIKEDFKVSALPSKWRSAKSVARRACMAGIGLLDPATKEPYGKTFVEKAVAGTKVALSPAQEAFFLLGKLCSVTARSGFAFASEGDKEHFKSQLLSLHSSV